MNILFLTLAYPEKIGERGIYIDLIRELRDRGNKITVVTPTERRHKKETSCTEQEGIKVLRVKTLNIQKCNMFEKGVSTLLLEKQFINGIKKFLLDEKIDMIIYSTPPITFEKVISFVKNRFNAKTYLLLKDIFPQNAVDIGIMKEDGVLYNLFRRKEKRLYNISDYIGCMSPKNKEYLIVNNKDLDESKVGICPNSIKPLEYVKSSVEEREEIREKYKVPLNKKVIVYGGNLGKPQGIEFLIRILEKNEERNDTFFLIIGGGTEYSRLKEWFDKKLPKNTLLYSMLPKEDYDKIIKACDIGLILLDNRFTIPNFPSRMLSYMEIGIPVLAATDKNTDVGKVIEEGSFGYSCESGDIDSFYCCIDKLVEDEKALEILGLNSRDYLDKNYTVEISADEILNKF